VGVEIFKDVFAKVKSYFAKMSKRRRITLSIVAGGVLLLAVVLTLILRNTGSKYTVLYTDISAAESSQVYQALLELGAKPEINSNGEIMVPDKEYDIWILQLAALGYPKTALTYDIFSSHSGLTSTESEKKQWLVYQLQDRIQATLSRIDGVSNATVTITMPENSGSVWQSAESKDKASAGVLLTLGNNVKLGGEQVAAIKNLVASSVPNMSPNDVTVVNSATGLELLVDTKGDGITSTENLLYEQTVQRQIEDNIVRLLTPRYGKDGVVAVAKVTIDYDKMIQERMELLERPDGGGFPSNDEGQYGIGGEVPAGEIVGEENNTDIPQYAYNEPGDEEGMTYYWWNRDYDYGYIKTQVEKGNAELSHATVSVMVKEENLTQALREELVSLVSNSVDIEPEFIYVASYVAPVEEAPPQPDSTYFWEDMPTWMLIAAGGALLLVIIIVIVIIVIVKRRRKLKRLRALAEEQETEESMLSEIEEYKRSLEALAKEGLSMKEEAVLNDVRSFAKDNPEITANLIRSWLKESD
jgi:flagellar biosynthesis/type III secretory pathway M-ring protein FliF/YscJ